MNWSTRLRRWVRIRTPPVREASTKPTAATVLPAPVACSNQKRGWRRGPRAPPRAAPRRVSASSQSCGSSSGASTSLVARRARRSPSPFAALAVRRRALAPLPRPLRRASPLGALDLGDDRGQRAGERVDLVVVELGAVAQRRLAPPRAGARGRAAASSRAATRTRAPRGRPRARRARRRPPGAGRCPGVEVGDRLALEQDRLTGELPHPIEVGLAQLARGSRGNVGGIGHGKGKLSPALAVIRVEDGERSKLGKGGRRAEVPSDRTDVPPRPTNCGTDMN